MSAKKPAAVEAPDQRVAQAQMALALISRRLKNLASMYLYLLVLHLRCGYE
jgi:hypothetical protein